MSDEHETVRSSAGLSVDDPRIEWPVRINATLSQIQGQQRHRDSFDNGRNKGSWSDGVYNVRLRVAPKPTAERVPVAPWAVDNGLDHCSMCGRSLNSKSGYRNWNRPHIGACEACAPAAGVLGPVVSVAIKAAGAIGTMMPGPVESKCESFDRENLLDGTWREPCPCDRMGLTTCMCTERPKEKVRVVGKYCDNTNHSWSLCAPDGKKAEANAWGKQQTGAATGIHLEQVEPTLTWLKYGKKRP